MRFALSAAVLRASGSRSPRAAWPRGRAQWVHLARHRRADAGRLPRRRLGRGEGRASAPAPSALLVGLQPVLTALWLTRSAEARGAAGVAARQWLGLVARLRRPRCWSSGASSARRGDAGEPGAGDASRCSASRSARSTRSASSRPATCARASAVQLVAALRRLPAARPARDRADRLAPATWSARWPGRSLVLTLGGSSLLYLLIQRGAATAVTSLLYLVPPCTALMAWVLFGESLTPAR